MNIPSANEFGTIGAKYRKYLKAETEILFKKVKHPYTGGKTDRPYVLGFGCDGSGDANVHFVAQKMVKSLGWDYAEIYHKAYTDARGEGWIEKDLGKLKDEALKSKSVESTTIIPEKTSVQTVLDELYDINNRSLVEELENRFEKAGIPLSTKIKDLKPPNNPKSFGVYIYKQEELMPKALEELKLKCPKCGSSQVYTLASNLRVCRRCNHRWHPEKKDSQK